MVEYRADRVPITDDQDNSGPWRTVALLVGALALLLGVLFATGFWNAQAQQPEKLPEMNVRAVGGLLPGIVVEPNNAITGTMKIPVDVPALDSKSGTDAQAK